LLGENLSQASGKDWSVASLGAGVGFIASYAALKLLRNKSKQEKRLVEPLL